MASCSCLRLCSVAVAFSNVVMGILIMVYGVFVLQELLYAEQKSVGVGVGLVIVYFQISTILIFVGLLLLIGIIKEREKTISLYLLLSSLVWFVITILAVSYMVFYHTPQPPPPTGATIMTTTTTTTAAPVPKVPKETVPLEKSVPFSVGLVLIWCGQLGVYKYHDQVIEKNVIDAGESYVSSAISGLGLVLNIKAQETLAGFIIIGLGVLLLVGTYQEKRLLILIFLILEPFLLAYESVKLSADFINYREGLNEDFGLLNILAVIGVVCSFILIYPVYVLYKNLEKEENVKNVSDEKCDNGDSPKNVVV